MAEPWNANTFADAQPLDASPYRVDPADNLMARNDRQHGVWQFAVDDMKICAADAAGGHFDAYFA
jgi:hypothetical protein